MIYFTDERTKKVTILILIDGFLQYRDCNKMYLELHSHNPYFNRWFSAIIQIASFEEAKK